MEQYKEYRALMKMNGRWVSGKAWNGQVLPTYRNHDAVTNAIVKVMEQWKKQAPEKPLPEEWTVQYREVTTTDWLKWF